MDGVMQIITGRERRRRWSVQDRLRIVAEPGTRVCDAAARHRVCESLEFTWRRRRRERVLVGPQAPTSLPVWGGRAAADDGAQPATADAAGLTPADLIGPQLRARTLRGRQGEVAVAVAVLGRMIRAAKPATVRRA